MSTFAVFVHHIDGDQRGYDVTPTTTVEELMEMIDEGDYYELLHGGDPVDESSTLEPGMELVMGIDRLKLAKRRFSEMICIQGSSFWEFGGGLTEAERADCPIMEFPKPTDININMMPFIFGDISSLPQEYHGYLPLLKNCWGLRKGSVCYLTIEESLVKKDTSQRRPGLHIETPGHFGNLHEKHQPGGSECPLPRLGGGSNRRQVSWGSGMMELSCMGGIYISSTVSDSCRIFNCRFPDEMLTKEGVIGPHGDVSHLEPEIKLACEQREKEHAGDGSENHVLHMKAKRMYWLTDSTPHESLPLPEDTYRQFFRVVSPAITVWFEDHSTPNPLGVVPPKEVLILKGNKFA